MLAGDGECSREGIDQAGGVVGSLSDLDGLGAERDRVCEPADLGQLLPALSLGRIPAHDAVRYGPRTAETATRSERLAKPQPLQVMSTGRPRSSRALTCRSGTVSARTYPQNATHRRQSRIGAADELHDRTLSAASGSCPVAVASLLGGRGLHPGDYVTGTGHEPGEGYRRATQGGFT
jgi:hypothetical protein